MKRFLNLICVIMVLASVCTTIAFASNTDNTFVLVYDFGDLLTDEEEEALITNTKPFADKAGCGFLFLTTIDTDSKHFVTYGDEIQNRTIDVEGYSDNQVLIMIDLQHDVNYISATGRAEDKVSPSEIDRVLERVSAKVDKNDYYSCFLFMAEQISIMYRQSNMADFRLLGFFPMNFKVIIGALIVALVVAFTLLGRHKAANNKTNAQLYLKDGDINVTGKNTTFVKSYDTVSRGYYKKSSSSGSSGHHSTGGRSRSSGSRRR